MDLLDCLHQFPRRCTFNHESAYSCCERPLPFSFGVKMMMRASGNSVRIAAAVSIPLISGSLRSMSVTSGRCVRNRLIPSCPFDACATKFMSGCAANSAAIPSRYRGWSSTETIRIEFTYVRLQTSTFTTGC